MRLAFKNEIDASQKWDWRFSKMRLTLLKNEIDDSQKWDWRFKNEIDKKMRLTQKWDWALLKNEIDASQKWDS